MSVCYGNAPIPSGFRVWIRVQIRSHKSKNVIGLDSNHVMSGSDMKKVWEYTKKQFNSVVAGYSCPDEVGVCIEVIKNHEFVQSLLTEVVSVVSVKANQIHFAANPIGFASGNVSLLRATGKLLILSDFEGRSEILPENRNVELKDDMIIFYEKNNGEWSETEISCTTL